MKKFDNNAIEDLLTVVKRLDTKGIVNAYEGNASIKRDGLIYVTPTGQNKGFLTSCMIAVLDMEGNQLGGLYPPSSEVLMHYQIYKERPDVNAVVHAHPPFLTGFAINNEPVISKAYAEVISVFDHFPLVPYGRPGTDEILSKGIEYVRDYNVFLIGNHGAVSLGEDIFQAMNRMEAGESVARNISIAKLIGEPKDLAPEEIAFLKGE